MRVPVFVQTQCMGLVTTVMGTWRVIKRIMMASQNKKGMIQFLSLRWTTTLAIHHLVTKKSSCQPAIARGDLAWKCALPSKETSEKDMDQQPESPVESRKRIR